MFTIAINKKQRSGRILNLPNYENLDNWLSKDESVLHSAATADEANDLLNEYLYGDGCQTCNQPYEKTYGDNNEWCNNCVPY